MHPGSFVRRGAKRPRCRQRNPGCADQNEPAGVTPRGSLAGHSLAVLGSHRETPLEQRPLVNRGNRTMPHPQWRGDKVRFARVQRPRSPCTGHERPSPRPSNVMPRPRNGRAHWPARRPLTARLRDRPLQQRRFFLLSTRPGTIMHAAALAGIGSATACRNVIPAQAGTQCTVPQGSGRRALARRLPALRERQPALPPGPRAHCVPGGRVPARRAGARPSGILPRNSGSVLHRVRVNRCNAAIAYCTACAWIGAMRLSPIAPYVRPISSAPRSAPRTRRGPWAALRRPATAAATAR